MIQRIQSIFLLISSASFWALFAFPFASSDEPTEAFLADKVYEVTDHVVLLVLVILGGVVALFSIFLFKNRPLQIRLSYLSLVIAILVPLTAVLLFYSEATKNFLNVGIDDGLGIYIPIIAIIGSILAVRYIRKDDRVVRSMDRLR